MKKTAVVIVSLIILLGLVLNVYVFLGLKRTKPVTKPIKQNTQSIGSIFQNLLTKIEAVATDNEAATTSTKITNKTTSNSKSTIKVDNIIAEQMNGGDVTVIDTKYGFKVAADPKFELNQGYNGFSLSFDKRNTTAPVSDYAKLEFRTDDLTEPSLIQQAQADLEEEASWTVPEQMPMLENFTVGSNGEIKGFSYFCPFLVTQKCIYIPLPNYPKKYLFILKTYTAEEGTTYSEDLDEILSTFEYVR